METIWKQYVSFKIERKENTNSKGENVHNIFYNNDIKETIPFPVIYRIQINEKTIPRILKPDSNGILAIGQTKNLDIRYKQMKLGFEKWDGHSEAILAHYIYTYSNLFWKTYIENKVISVCYYKSTDLNQDEAREIIRYIKNFGEPPPFNSALPGRYVDNIWEQVFNE